ncbi:hypothetical protein DFP72DRAFT_1077676 [Ephemerocybe angulata]|uniref:Zinc finger PHD-type domain-containing protein n=1 Tax=Ephemerocybe angulata TaxID=980116 RepID=A0A8H6HF92_9AGAR|nr:hypothetical protein DFP72DRAFT_1077676 [Tulosesus angulatus]
MKRIKRAVLALFSDEQPTPQAPAVYSTPYPPNVAPGTPYGPPNFQYGSIPPGYYPNPYLMPPVHYPAGFGHPGHGYVAGVPQLPPQNAPAVLTAPHPPILPQRSTEPAPVMDAAPKQAPESSKRTNSSTQRVTSKSRAQHTSETSESSSDDDSDEERAKGQGKGGKSGRNGERVCTATPGTDEYDWPDGDLVRKYSSEESAPPNKDLAKWQFRSHGKSSYNHSGDDNRFAVALGKARTSKCLGVDICPDPSCSRPVKPLTNVAAEERQIEKGCTVCRAAPLIHQECDVKCHRYLAKDVDTGNEYYRWEHRGNHLHPRPPASHLSPSESAQLDAQVTRGGYSATVHALRTGDLNPGSVPLAQISPILADPSTARYYVAKSKVTTGMKTASAQRSGGGGPVVKQILGLNTELGEVFLRFSQLHGQGAFVFKTDFMNTILESTVEEWAAVDSDIGARHGLVTDGNHTFFREGVLLTSCAFNSTTKTWVPVLYTLIYGEDEAHHRIHFEHLFDPIMKKVERDGLRFEKEFLLNVMDFSQAQRNAHADAYAQAVSKTMPGFSGLSQEAQLAQMTYLREEAKSLEVGCDFHFWSQATRVKGTAALVDPESSKEFGHLLHKMVSKKTSSDIFDETVAKFRRDFPEAAGWLSWWLQPAIIGMVFPAKSSVNPEVAEQVPSTSNAAEHTHSHLNHAVGPRNELIEGIKKLHLHVKRFESEYTAVRSGHYTPAGPRENRPPKRVKFFDNDGRAPDTVDAINALEPSSKLAPGALQRCPLFGQCYAWDGVNSCFYDHGLELLFRAYCLWPEDARARFRNLLPTDSFLQLKAAHFDRRLKLITHSKKKDKTVLKLLTDALKDFQQAVREKIFTSWNPDLSATGHHSATVWIQESLQDGGPCFEAQQFFGHHHSIMRRCGKGHESSSFGRMPRAVVRLHLEYLEIVKEGAGESSIGLGNYFSQLVLFKASAETPVLDDSVLLNSACDTPECKDDATPCKVIYYWPQTLTVESNSRMSPKVSKTLRFDESFTISDSSEHSITYTLVGRVLHPSRKDHFTAEVAVGGAYYTYDDMKSKLRRAKAGTRPLEKRSINEVYYVYHRSSKDSSTVRSVDEIMSDYSRFGSKDMELGTNADHPESITSGSSSGFSVYEDDAILPVLSSDGESEDIPLRLFARPGPSKPRSQKQLSVVSQTEGTSQTAGASGATRGSGNEVTHVPQAIPSCLSCGLRGPAVKNEIRCDLCEVMWHRVCVQRFLPDSHEDMVDFRFCCPQCRYSVNGRWDQLMLNTYVLVGIAQVSHLKAKEGQPTHYPAQIVSRIGDTATLQWHIYMDWPKKAAIEIICGSIYWPLVLQSNLSEKELAIVEAADAHILQALAFAQPAILEILDGTRHHPIVTLFQSWVQSLSNSTQGTERRHHNLRFSRTFFHLPIYPGHSLIIDNYMALEFQRELSDDEQASALVWVLLRLVAIRQYLRLPTSDDAEVYEVCRIPTEREYEMSSPEDGALRARLHREPTIHEKAFFCSQSNVFGRLDGPDIDRELVDYTEVYAKIGARFKGRVGRTKDLDGVTTLDATAGYLKVFTEDGSPYIFGSYSHYLKDEMELAGVTAAKKPPAAESESPPTSPRPFPHPEADKPATAPKFKFRIIGPKPDPPKQPKPKKKTGGLAQTTLTFPTRQTRQVTMDQRVQVQKRNPSLSGSDDEEPQERKRAKRE